MYRQIGKRMIYASIVAAMALAVNANGADRAKDKDRDRVKDDGSRFSERIRNTEWQRGKDELSRALKTGEERDFYRRELERLGYQITSVNYDKADYIEYELVKGNQTWEVQIDIDKNSHKATKVDVSSNMWQADSTDRVLKGKQVSKADKSPDNKRFSDRDRKKGWERGKEELTRALKVGEEKPFYRRELEKLGYQITSVNSDKADYLEYEIVKSDRTYEVAIDMDKNSHKATKVDVGTNVYKADATEQALKKHQAKR